MLRLLAAPLFLPSPLLALLHLLGCWALGKRLNPHWPPLACVLAGLLLGHHLVLGLGMMGALNKTLLATLWALLALFGLYKAGRHSARLRQWAFASVAFLKNGGPLTWLAFAAAGLTVLAAATGAQAPAMGYDDLNYHLAMPLRWLRQGAITPTWDIHHGFFPMLLELNGLWLMAFAPDQAARWLNVGLALGVGAELARWFHQPQNSPGEASCTPGSLACLLWLTLPLVVLEMQMLAVEIVLAACALVAFGGLWRTRENPFDPQGWWQLGLGLAAGLSQKFTFLPMAALAGLWAMANLRRAGLRPVLVYAACLLAALPVYLRNTAWTGNPLYPFLGEVFTRQPHWNAHLVQHYEKALYHYGGLGHDWVFFVRLPWDWLMHDNAFHGPFTWALALAPLALWGTRHAARWGRLAGGVFVLATFFWFKASQDIRHLLPWMPLFLLWLGAAAQALPRPAAWLMTAGLVLSIAAHTAQAWTGNDAPARRWRLLTHPDPLYVSHFPHPKPYQRACATVQKAPGPSRILLMDTLSHTYYLRCPHSIGHFFFQGYWDWWRIKTPAQFRELARRRGVTHLLVQERFRHAPYPPFVPPHYPAFTRHLLGQHARLLWRDQQNGILFYRLKEPTD